MPEPMILFSSDAMTTKDFTDLMDRIGATFTQHDDLFKATVSDANRHVWIFLEHTAGSQFNKEELQPVIDKLGSIPKTEISFKISRKAGSEKLAYKSALAIAQDWPSVLLDYTQSGRVLSVDEMQDCVRRAL